jgi:hypothetical protein
LGALSFHRSAARLEPSTPSSSSEAAQVEASRGPDSDPTRRSVVGDTPSILGSSDVAALGDEELGLPGFPRAPPLPTDWASDGGTELACSQVMTMHRLLCETLAMVSRDVL